MKAKRIIFGLVLIMVSLCVFSACDKSQDTSTGKDQNTSTGNDKVTVTFRRNLDNLPSTLSGLTYDENWFFEDSYEYNQQLALMSMGLVLAGYDDSLNYDPVGKSGDQYVKSLFRTLKFPEDAYYSVGYNQSDNENIALAMSSKNIIKDGVSRTLLAVDLRSGGYGDGGWQGNMNVGAGVSDTGNEDNTKYHIGFYNGATFAVEQINTYMNAHSIDYTNTIFWIVGYSRGAAVANLTSIFLDEYTDNRDSIFTYAGATPTYEMNPVHDDNLDNIHNILNTGDIVTMVPPTAWGFGIQGSIHELPALTEENRTDFEERFSELAGTEYYGFSDYTAIGENIFTLLTQYFDSREDYANQLQPFLKTIFDPNIGEEKAVMVYIRNLLTCDGNIVDNTGILQEIMNLASTAFTEGGDAPITEDDVMAILTKIGNASTYWEENGNSNKAALIYNAMNVFLNIYISLSGDSESNVLLQQTIDAVLECVDNGITSPLLFQHWTELYICRLLVSES